jgi:hypothetical protein
MIVSYQYFYYLNQGLYGSHRGQGDYAKNTSKMLVFLQAPMDSKLISAMDKANNRS